MAKVIFERPFDNTGTSAENLFTEPSRTESETMHRSHFHCLQELLLSLSVRNLPMLMRRFIGTGVVLCMTFAISGCSGRGEIPKAPSPTPTPTVKVTNLFVVNGGTNNVTEYAPPYTGVPTTISNSMNAPLGLAFDARGALFVANVGNNTVTKYAPPYTGAPAATISSGLNGPVALAFDASGALFVANVGNVTQYAPPYTGAPTATINNLNKYDFLPFDARDDLIVVT